MNLIWSEADDERQALFYNMVSEAYQEDTPTNESTRDEVWHNEIMLKYFDYERYKNDLLKDGWVILQNNKGYAVIKEDDGDLK